MRSSIGRRPIDAAVIYARRCWAVFPCHCPVSGGCSCGNRDCSSPAKHPRVAGGLKSATTDEEQIREWWARWPRANVAVRTGAISGLVVLDIDPQHGGEETRRSLLGQHPELGAVRTIRTGSGGRHLYFAHPGGTVHNDAGKRLGPGLDVRGDGGYVIAPPSRHAHGALYRVEANGGAIPELPDWLVDLMAPPEPPRPVFPAPSIGNKTAWAHAALGGELEKLHAAHEGARNDTLNRVAYRLGRLVASGVLAEPEVEALLVNGAVAIGLNGEEALRTTRSGLLAGERLPTHTPANPPERDVMGPA
jgi:hypothetical protein